MFDDEVAGLAYGEEIVGCYGWYRKTNRSYFRCSPVAGMGGYGGGRYYRMRHERNRIREYCKLKEDGFRLRGGYKNIGDSWDDIARSDIKNKNWKCYRKTQYKNKS